MDIDFKDLLKNIPSHMHIGLIGYVQEGRRPGGFLTRLLSGDESTFDVGVDPLNAAHKEDWVSLCYKLPKEMRGSPERVEAWIARGGHEGGIAKDASTGALEASAMHLLCAQTLDDELAAQPSGDIIRLPRAIVRSMIQTHKDTAGLFDCFAQQMERA